MRRAVLWSVVVIATAASATARERSFRPINPMPSAVAAQSALCKFTAPQLSGYRTRAGERRICYYDCGGLPTAIVIRSSGLCSSDQTVLVWNSDSTVASLERRPRGNGKLASIVPAPTSQ